MIDKLTRDGLREIKDRCQLRREHIEKSYTDDRTIEAQLCLHHVTDREALFAHIEAQERKLDEARELIEELREAVDEEWGCDCGDHMDPPCLACRARYWLEGGGQ